MTTWAGGSKAWQKTDWEPLRGRAISLMADADESSRTAMRQLAYYMDSELDCAVHVALPDGENGEDVADWLEDGVEPAAERVESLLQPYEPDEEDRTEPPADPPPPIEGDIGQNDHYQILGLDGDAVAIWWAAGGRVLSKSGESLCQPATLISFASQALWCRLADADSLGSATARRIGDSLIRVAEDIGQADLSGRTGTGAVMLKAGAAFHLGDRKLFDGKEHVLNDRLDGRIWLAEPRVELGPEASDEEMRAIAESVMAYRWDTPADGKRFLGWLVAGLVGGALEWRVHLYLAGEASTGKSWLLKHVLDLIMGPLYYKIADATPAALARLAENGSVPMVIDEAEPTNEWVVELMKLLRVSAGAEGLRVRADGASGGVVTQLPRFAALLSSTAMPDMHRADATRMSVVKLGEEVEDWSTTQRNIKTALLKADGARSRIIRRMPEIVAEAARVAESLEGHGNDSRAAMMSGALTAGWRAWGLDTFEVNSQRSDPRDELPDAIRMLVDMLSLPFRLDSGREITVLEALQSAVDPWHVADTFGLKRSTGVDKREDGGLAIWPGHSKLRSDLGRRSDRWARTDYEQLLLQATGATQSGSKTVRFGPHRKRAVLIPQQTLLKYGIPVVRDEIDEDDAEVADEQGALV